MNLNDFAYNLLNRLPASQYNKAMKMAATGVHAPVMRVAPGETYGPAVSRITRTPIDYMPLDKGLLGVFAPPTNYQMSHGGEGRIFVDPTKAGKSNTIRHESIHALLDQLDYSGKLGTLNQMNPYYDQAVGRFRRANAMQELPAYMGAYNADPKGEAYSGVPLNLRDAYMKYFRSDLARMRPDIEQKLGRLSTIEE